MIISDAIVKFDDLCPNDPTIFDYVSSKGLGVDCAMVRLGAHLLLA